MNKNFMKVAISLLCVTTLLFGSVLTFSVPASAADFTTVAPTGILQSNTTDHGGWWIWLKVNTALPEGLYYNVDAVPVTLTDIDGNVLASSDDASKKIYSTFQHDGDYLIAMLYGGAGYATNNQPKEGDTIRMAAGSYVSNTNASVGIALQHDVVLFYQGGTWHLGRGIDDSAAQIAGLGMAASWAQSATTIYSAVLKDYGLSIPQDGSWDASVGNYFQPADYQSGAFFNGTRFSLGNGAFYSAAATNPGFYITGFGTAAVGDEVTLKGNFYSPNTGESFTLVAPVTFTYMGDNVWEPYYELTVPVPNNLPVISWENFANMTVGAALPAATYGKLQTNGGSMNNTVFNGDLEFGSVSSQGICFASTGELSHGIMIAPIDANTLKIFSNIGSGSLLVKTRGLGLTSFVGERFNLKMKITNAVDYQVDLEVWINDHYVGAVTIAMTDYKTNGQYGQGYYVYGGDPTIYAPSTSIPGTDGSVPTDLETFTWKDLFNLVDGTYTADQSGYYKNNQVRIEGGLLQGYVTLAGSEHVNVFGPLNNWNWGGVKLYPDDAGTTMIVLGSLAISGLEMRVPAAAVGATSFVNERMLLQASAQYVDQDGDGEKDDLKFGLWINGVNAFMVDTLGNSGHINGFKYVIDHASTNADGALTAGMMAGQQGIGATLESYMPVPEDLTEVTWEDIEPSMTEYPVLVGQPLYYQGQSYYYNTGVNNTLFNGDFRFAEAEDSTYLRWFGGSNVWQGIDLQVLPADSGATFRLRPAGFKFMRGVGEVSLNFNPADFGMTSFLERFNLKMALTNLAADAKSADLHVWINNIYAGWATITATGSDTIGNQFVPADEGDGPGSAVFTPYAATDEGGSGDSIVIPSPSETLTWSDFKNGSVAIENGIYTGSTGGYAIYGWSSDYDVLNGVKFVGEVKLGLGAEIHYGGADPSHGVVLTLQSDGTLKLSSPIATLAMADGSDLKNVFTASELGINGAIADQRLKVAFQMWDVSDDRLSTRFAAWVNDTLLGVYDVAVNDACVGDPYNAKWGDAIGLMSGTFDVGPEPVVITIPDPVGELTWADFNVNSSTAYNDAGWLYGGLGYTPNGYKFVGRVKLANGAYVNYGAGGLQWGFHIQQNGSGLSIDCYGGQGTLTAVSGKKVYTAAELGVTGAMADTEFTLGIQMWDVSSDLKNGRFAVWFNDTLLGVYDIAVTHPDVLLGQYAAIHDTTKTSTVASTFSGEPETLPTDYTVITPLDFGYNGTYSVTAGNGGGSGTTTKVSSWDKVILQFDSISFTGDFDLVFGGDNDWTGFKLLYRDGKTLSMQSAYGNILLPKTFAADLAGVNFAAGNSYMLQISMAYTDSTKTQMKIGVWFEGVLYANRYFYADLTQTETGFALDQMRMGFCNTGNEAGTVTLYTEVEYEKLPEDFTVLRPYDFGVSDGIYYGDTANVGIVFNGKADVASVDKTLWVLDGFSANCETWLWIAGDPSNDWYGLQFRVNTNGTGSLVQGGTSFTIPAVTFTKDIAGVDILGGTYSLKFTFEQPSSTELKVGVWFNDVLYNNEYITITNVNAAQVGPCLRLYPALTGGKVVIRSTNWETPTDLNNINFGSFDGFEENTKYPLEIGKNSVEGTYQGGSTLLNTSFRGNVTFHYESTGDYYMCYGGIASAGTWNGLRIQVCSDKITFPSGGETAWSNVGKLALYPADFGLTSFTDSELELGIDLVMYGETDDMLMYFYINGTLYNNAPMVLFDFGSDIGNAWVLYAANHTSDYYQLGSFSRDLIYDLYHDLSKGDYTYYDPNGVQQSITLPGVYDIEWNDGAFTYTQTIIAYEVGDPSADGKINVLDVVKTLVVLAKGGNDESFDKSADWNEDGTVTADDVTDLRLYLLGKEQKAEEGSVMPIGGFYGPFGALANEEIFKAIADLGITEIVSTDYAYTNSIGNAAKWNEMLTMAQNNGLQMFVSDNRLSGSTSYSAADMNKLLSAYNHFQSFAGVRVIDEPGILNSNKLKSYPLSSDWERTVAQFANLSTSLANVGVNGYVNLLPYWKSLATNSDGSTLDAIFGGSNPKEYASSLSDATAHQRYYNYVTTAIQDMNLPYVSYDHYPFDAYKVTNCNEYFQNMAIIAAAAKQQGLTWRPHLQAGSNWNDQAVEMSPTNNSTPTEGEFFWNANISLAMGAKALQYFPMIQPQHFALTENGQMDYERNGLIGANGELTVWGEYATTLNAYVRKIDDILMNAEHKGVIATDGYAQSVGTANIASATANVGGTNPVVTSYGHVEEVYAEDGDYGAFVGCFDGTGKYEGKTIYYVVNYNVDDAQVVELYLDSEQNYEILYMNDNYDWQDSGDTIAVEFELGGEAALVIVG